MNKYCPLYQIDVQNAFLNEDLEEKIYMRSLPQGLKFSSVIKCVNLKNHYIVFNSHLEHDLIGLLAFSCL